MEVLFSTLKAHTTPPAGRESHTTSISPTVSAASCGQSEVGSAGTVSIENDCPS
jgi:hypothetical protein